MALWKPRAHTQVPDFVTVGGCKIVIRVLNQEEVGQPFTLHSVSSEDKPEESNNSIVSASINTSLYLLILGLNVKFSFFKNSFINFSFFSFKKSAIKYYLLTNFYYSIP